MKPARSESKCNVSALDGALNFILQYSVKLVKFDHNVFKFIDTCVNFDFSVRH